MGEGWEKVWIGENEERGEKEWRFGRNVWIGFWGVGELTYLFLINFFDQIRAKNPHLIGFLNRYPLIFELIKGTNIK